MFVATSDDLHVELLNIQRSIVIETKAVGTTFWYVYLLNLWWACNGRKVRVRLIISWGATVVLEDGALMLISVGLNSRMNFFNQGWMMEVGRFPYN